MKTLMWWMLVLMALIMAMVVLTIYSWACDNDMAFWMMLFIVYPFFCLCLAFFKKEFDYVWNHGTRD